MADEGRCRYCDAEEKPYSSSAKDHCHWVGEFAEKLKGVRSIYCYERQIADLTKRLEAWRVFHRHRNDLTTGGFMLRDMTRRELQKLGEFE